MNINVLLIYAMIVLGNRQFLQCQSLSPGRIDYQGFNKFWPISDKLSADQTPSNLEWEELFDTACYQKIKQDYNEELMKQRFNIAFMPSLKRERDSVLSVGSYESRILNHLINARQSKVEIHHFIDSLKAQPFLKNALELTQTYLPGNFIVENKNLYPPVAFGIFEPDGKADSEIIAIDAAFARSIDFQRFLAHEAHHFFIGKIRKKMREASGADSYMLRTIRQLHLEGIADLIDKKQILDLPDTLEERDNWYSFHYRRHYKSARETLKKVDSLIAILQSPHASEETGKKIWNSFHFGTHPEALHMALLIESTFGKDHIIKDLSNPFEFLRSYQKAAISAPENGHVFSKNTLEYFDYLEDTYLYTE